MPTFPSPQPIAVSISLLVADVRVRAGDRDDTVVEIKPSNPSSKADNKVVELTNVEYIDGQLVIKTPRQAGSFFGRTGSLEISIDLPAGSDLHGEIGMGSIDSRGRLGECQLKTGMGAIRLDETRAIHLTTDMGDLIVGQAAGEAMVATGGGEIRIRGVDGAASVKNSDGHIWIGTVTGDLHVKSAHGSISVDRAHARVSAKTAHGSVRVGELIRGAAVVETAHGDLAIGIRSGTAAWLDVRTRSGHVRNELLTTAGPDDTDETVEVRAHTYTGDIVIHRSSVGEPQ